MYVKSILQTRMSNWMRAICVVSNLRNFLWRKKRYKMNMHEKLWRTRKKYDEMNTQYFLLTLFFTKKTQTAIGRNAKQFAEMANRGEGRASQCLNFRKLLSLIIGFKCCRAWEWGRAGGWSNSKLTSNKSWPSSSRRDSSTLPVAMLLRM